MITYRKVFNVWPKTALILPVWPRTPPRNNNINGASLKWSLCCHARGTPCVSQVSSPQNVTTGHSNLWPGPKPPVSLETVCKDNKKAVIMTNGVMATGSKIKNIV